MARDFYRDCVRLGIPVTPNIQARRCVLRLGFATGLFGWAWLRLEDREAGTRVAGFLAVRLLAALLSSLQLSSTKQRQCKACTTQR